MVPHLDSSAPHKRAWESKIEDDNWVRISIATIGSTDLPVEIFFEWASIGSINELLAIFIEGGKLSGIQGVRSTVRPE